MRLTYGSICSGYGGLDMGVQSVLGGETRWFCENDKAPSKILAHHWPDVPNLGDITKIDWSDVEPVDVLTGGTPCQDLSHAGKRAGMAEGTRSNLWVQMREAIAVLRPRLVVWENVRGALSAPAEGGTNGHEPCLCGRTDRRGGVHSPRHAAQDVPSASECGNDPTRTRSSDESGRSGGRGGVDPIRAGESGEWAAPVDPGSTSEVRGDQAADSRTERQGSTCACPECGGCVDASVCAVEPCAGCVGTGDERTVLRALGRVLGDLVELGYDARWYGLRAADVGAAHGRFRVFLFATPADASSDGRWPNPRPGQPNGLGIADGVGRRGADDLTLLPTPACNDMGEGKTVEAWDEWLGRMKSEHGNGNGHGKSLASEAQRLLPTPRTSDANGAGVHGTGGPDLRTAVMVTLCAGCSVREPWEHRCEGPTCVCGECSEERRLFDEKCPTCGCSIDFHDAGGFCAGPCGGNGFKCYGRTDGEAQRLLPTPTVNDAGNVGGESQFDRNTVPLSHALLPTPRATDGTKGGPNQRGSSGDLMLPSAVQLLPTPSVADVEGGRKHRSGARSDELLLNGIAHHQAWGDYAPAIARWETVLGRPAPAPTERDWERWEARRQRRLTSTLPVGMRGSIRFILDGPTARLSPAFVEWLMGLPAGHVTGVDIPRNAQLKALGNGVVPPQSAAATRAFVEDITTDRASAGTP